MCGIVGFNAKENAFDFLLKGLERLEYRGYDSAGIAVINNNQINCVKAKGRIKNLYEKEKLSGGIGIGHTRWATHGAPTNENAHPHLSKNKKFAVVHNGIIENYIPLREFLNRRFFPFYSETDTEVIAHLIEYYYQGDAVEAIIKASQRLKGSYALAILCLDTPDILYAMRKDSPLVIGINELGMCASDMTALIDYTREFIIPDEGEIALIKGKDVSVYNFNRELIEKTPFTASWEKNSNKKTGYQHFMLKEIYEQPKAVYDTLNSLKLENLNSLKDIKKINLIGCGSAYHAAMTAKYFIESLARIPVECDMASEFRYKNPIITDNTLAIAISQSGETADTIAALKEAKKYCKTLSVVNVLGSLITRISDEVIYTLAGPEIAVATTKGYLCQVAVLLKTALFLSKNSLNKDILNKYQEELDNLHLDIASLLKEKKLFQQLSARFSSCPYAFFIGRGIDYAIAMESALKLKEISYIHAQSYPSGELKHGTISLIEKSSLVIAIATQRELIEKNISNIKEVQSRGATVISITPFDEIKSITEYCISIKEGITSPLLASVASQLFAYYTALNRALDIDKPRNLAKSVTVE